MFDYTLQKEFFNIFNEINESVNDYDTLLIGIEIIKIATERLNSDLDNENIKKEYNKLKNIISELEEIKDNYI